MRIIGGALRGRRLLAKPGRATRPTADRVREAIASALDARGLIEGACVLDLFAGTGALAFEALSRGADAALLVDDDRRAVEAMRLDAEQLELSARAHAVELDLFGSAKKVESTLRARGLPPFSLVFADPPYARIDAALGLLERLAQSGLLASGGAIVVEYAQRSQLVRPAAFAEITSYRYGDSAIALWETVATRDQT